MKKLLIVLAIVLMCGSANAEFPTQKEDRFVAKELLDMVYIQTVHLGTDTDTRELFYVIGKVMFCAGATEKRPVILAIIDDDEGYDWAAKINQYVPDLTVITKR